MEEEKIIKEETEKLFKEIDIEAKVDVKKEDEVYNVFVDTDENALLIGKHGNTLSSLEIILSLIVTQKTNEYKRIVLEIGGYRKEREEYLLNLAKKFKEEVLESDLEKKIRGLKSWERRLIHVYFSEDDEITTESIDEDRDRVLVIKKKE